MADGRRTKRVLALGGGGPVAGLHIGALEAFRREGIEFDVWSMSCIGAWVGVIYHTRDVDESRKAQATFDFFRDTIFRDDDGYERFPVNRAFGPDIQGTARAWLDYLFRNEKVFDKLVLPGHIQRAMLNSVALLLDGRWLNDGDRAAWLLNDIMAVNPLNRLATSLVYRSAINGLAKILYPGSSFLKGIDFDTLPFAEPQLYHNAWDLENQAMRIFSNRMGHRPITQESVCACSALPYIEQTVDLPIGDKQVTHCEGTLVDTVSFKDVLLDHPDVDEIWVSRVVGIEQVNKPTSLHDNLSNLCQLFAAEVGHDDVKLLRTHLRKTRKRLPRIVEIPLARTTRVNFEWSHGNLSRGRAEGFAAVKSVLQEHPELRP